MEVHVAEIADAPSLIYLLCRLLVNEKSKSNALTHTNMIRQVVHDYMVDIIRSPSANTGLAQHVFGFKNCFPIEFLVICKKNLSCRTSICGG